MEDYKIVKNDKIYSLDDYRNTKVIFINCKIRDLKVKDSFFPNLHFIGCEISNSTFKETDITGLVISQDPQKAPEKVREKITEYIKDVKINESTIQGTKFLFCKLNDIQIDNTELIDSKLKHCIIERLKIMGNVMFKNLDLRGSKFLEPDFGDCKFDNIKFTKGFFLIDWIDSLLRPLITMVLLFLSLTSKKKWYLRRRNLRRIKLKGGMMRVRQFIKKILYKLKLGLFVDSFSSTDYQNAQYGEAEFYEDYHFLWYIQDLDFIFNFKRKHPFFSRLTFVTSNYMQSFGALLLFCFGVVWVFSLFYSANWADFGRLPLDYPLYLSCKIFTNFGIDPLDAQNGITKFLVIFEIIIGYFALGTLLSIIFFPFARRASLPVGKKKK